MMEYWSAENWSAENWSAENWSAENWLHFSSHYSKISSFQSVREVNCLARSSSY